MKNNLKLLLVAVAAMFTLSSSGIAQVTPSADAYTNSAAATTNYGTASTLGVVSSSTSIQSSFVQFDFSSIPSGFTGANIAKASLKLYVNTVTTAGSFNVDYVNGTWSEKTITASVSPALGTTIASSVPLTTAQAHDYILIDVTTAVQAWLNNSLPNDGLALVANSPLSATFDSKENTTQSHAPELDIVFAGSGGTGTITGVTAGAGLVGGGTSGNVTLSMIKTCASGQVLQWNGTAWICANSGTGTVTNVSSGTGLTGGPITSTGTLSIANAGVSNAMLQNPSLTLSAGSGLTGGGSVSLGGATTLGLLTSCASGQILKWSGSAWACAADANSGGTITGVTAGTDLTGGGTAGNITLNLNTAALQTAYDARYAQLNGTNIFTQPILLNTSGPSGVVAYASSVGLEGNAVTGVIGSTTGSGGNAFGVLGASTNATAVRGNDAGSGSGVVGTSQSGVGVYGTTAASGGSANGVQGASTNATAVRGDDAGGGSGVVGTSASGYGVYGASANGFGVGTNSNVQQSLGMGGWVKAMAYVDPYAPGGIAVTRCFNSQQTGAAVYTPPCGMSVVWHVEGYNILDFGLPLGSSFSSVLPAITQAAVNKYGAFPRGVVGNVDYDGLTASQVAVTTYNSGDSSLGTSGDVDVAFMIVID